MCVLMFTLPRVLKIDDTIPPGDEHRILSLVCPRLLELQFHGNVRLMRFHVIECPVLGELTVLGGRLSTENGWFLDHFK